MPRDKGRKKEILFPRRRLTPEEVIHDQILRLGRLDRKYIRYFSSFYSHLASEREKILDKILDVMWSARTVNLEMTNASRIVDAIYQTHPLCSVGSISEPPGGRFNFAMISSYFQDFQALYIANDYETAFRERFKETTGTLTANELALRPINSFTHVRLNVRLDNCLDVRSKKTLEPLAELLSKIKATPEHRAQARKLGLGIPVTLQNASELFFQMTNPHYQHLPTWLDQPAPSQWLGHFARQAGFQGVVFPSVRNLEGFNVAIFLDNFKDSSCQLRLVDPMAAVPDIYRLATSDSYKFFLQPAIVEKVSH